MRSETANADPTPGPAENDGRDDHVIDLAEDRDEVGDQIDRRRRNALDRGAEAELAGRLPVGFPGLLQTTDVDAGELDDRMVRRIP